MLRNSIKVALGSAFINVAIKRATHEHGFILVLHRVVERCEDACLPHNSAYCISKSRFTHLLCFLKHHFQLVGLEEVLANTPSQKPKLALTFDGGWGDNYRHAFPVLQKLSIPATMFLSTAYIGEARGFWWESVARRLWNKPETVDQERLIMALAGSGIDPYIELFDTEKKHTRSRLIARFIQQLNQLDPIYLNRLVADIFFDGRGHAMNWQEVAFMERSGLIRFGANGHEHYDLTRLPPVAYTEDVLISQRLLEQNCTKPLKQYAYPGGAHHADLHQLLSSLGFTHGLSSDSGVLRQGVNQYALPRIEVNQRAAEQPSLLAWRILQAQRKSSKLLCASDFSYA